MSVVKKLFAGAGAFAGVYIFLAIVGFAAWLTHIINCLDEGSWGFLIAGALLFPIAVIHGIGIWFGAW